MKLLLCSEGFSTPEIVEACVNLAGKPPDQISIGVINEGYAVELDDKRWVINNLNDVANNFSGKLDLVNLLALSTDGILNRLQAVDVIFVVGGNTDYLMHVFQISGLATLLPALLESKVYVGSSAGSMVLGHRISTEAYQDIYGEDLDFGITKYMDLVDLAIKPHLYSPVFPNNRPEVLERVARGLEFPVYGLRDDSAVIVNGEDISIIGSDPFLIAKK